MAVSEKPPAEAVEPQVAESGVKRPGDIIFKGLSTASAFVIVLALAGVAAFLLQQGLPALDSTPEESFGQDNIWDLVIPLAFGTVYAAIIALAIAAPLSIGVALVISHYAPRPIAKALGWLVDLLAAIPSVVYGLWGITTLAPAMVPVYNWLSDNLSFIPFFDGQPSASGRTFFTAGLVLAVMALPIITAICREVFAQTPVLHQEAALALGATKWEMIRMTVFPYGRSGVISANLLGLGRALGETMAVALVLSATIGISLSLVSPEESSATIASNIALKFGEASGGRIDALIFTGLVLFVLTFAVNFAGRAIANKSVKA